MSPDTQNGRVTLARLEERIRAVESRVGETATKADIDHLRADISRLYAEWCDGQRDHEVRIRVAELHVASSEQRWTEHEKDHEDLASKFSRDNWIGSIVAGGVGLVTVIGAWIGLRP